MCKENEDSRLRTIYVQGLAWKTTSDDLRRYFQGFGEVVDSHIISESSGISKGFGFVTFKDDESVARALEIRNPIIDGRTTDCDLAYTKNQGSSNDHAEPSHRYQSNSQQASTQQHQPNSQYRPRIVWDPITREYYYVYNNRSDSNTDYSMILYQDWINMTVQKHLNNNTDQASTSQQYQPNSQYNPVIVWYPISSQFYYVYDNRFDSYTNSMILYQDWINMTVQKHLNNNTDQASTSQQYQPNSQYNPVIVWYPISSQFYYVYDNRFDSYTNSMILYQDWINMTVQKHLNNNTDQASTSQQYQPNSQYNPVIVWYPISSQFYYVYDNRFDSYTNSMILYQDWINMTVQKHLNNNTDQASTSQQYQPNSQYNPVIVWYPISSQFYYVYDNRFDSYTNSMIFNQALTNLAQQNHLNNNTNQQNNVAVDNDQDED